jgi:hypothetical protein
MERLPGNERHYQHQHQYPPAVTSQTVEGLLGANATRHILYLLDGQYLYQSQAEYGSIRYKFLSAHSVRSAFSREPVDSGWLAPEICRWGYGPSGQWAVMFIPPASYTLWLPSLVAAPGNGTPGHTEGQDQELNGGWLAVQVPLPGLVLAGAGQQYYIWAVKAREFSPQLAAYHAPLPNVYPDGRICWGSNQVGPVTAQYLREAWKLFIGSPFNAHLAQRKSKRCNPNILDQLRKLGAANRKAYPAGDLLPLKNGRGGSEEWTINWLVEQLKAASERPGG